MRNQREPELPPTVAEERKRIEASIRHFDEQENRYSQSRLWQSAIGWVLILAAVGAALGWILR